MNSISSLYNFEFPGLCLDELQTNGQNFVAELGNMNLLTSIFIIISDSCFKYIT